MIIGKFIDLSGNKYGRLTVLKRIGTKHNSPLWECVCDCIKREQIIEYNHTKKKYNTYDLLGEYGIGYTSKGKEFYFDLEDYDKIKNYCWYINNKGYVSCTITKNKISTHILMHKIIMDSPNDEDVDHINGIHTRNDNRKINLRKCTHQMNMCNYSKPKNNTSGVTGVSWDKTHLVWKSYITYWSKRINLGNYKNFDDAVKARLLAEKKYFGEYSSQKHLYDKYQV